ncbi:urotensin 1 [Gouania willdenowi]|uniref:Corticotropin-releasing factor domain-containing protein n=1 Tax=Gouania willdenowi TaxID=441366 RepID=A0A8C5G5C1_GOUWI|nr:urocortin [Gouania willdenowi]
MTSSLFLLLISSILLLSNQQPVAHRPRLLHSWWDNMENLLLHSSAGEPGQNVLRVLHSRSSDLLRLQRDDWGEGAELLKRSNEPPLSIDLTFHLLRNMIQMAQVESLRERAQLNRKVLDEVGRK